MKWNRYTRYKLLYLHWRLGEVLFDALLTEMEIIHNVYHYQIPKIRYHFRHSPAYFNNWL